jgi:hypothetical protein
MNILSPRKTTLAVVVVAAALCSAALGQQPDPVRTEYGLVRGATEEGLTVYRGVPFAVPPVGDLRWRPPQPVAKWDGVLIPGDQHKPRMQVLSGFSQFDPRKITFSTSLTF